MALVYLAAGEGRELIAPGFQDTDPDGLSQQAKAGGDVVFGHPASSRDLW